MSLCELVGADDHGVIHPSHDTAFAFNPKEGLSDKVSDLPPNGKDQHGDEG